MALKLKLFVHGVPKGQKIWGPQEEDRNFIENFYGRKADIEVQLFIDIIQIGNSLNSYYTYYRKGDILDMDNRLGSYFALTVRSNAYYTDLVNMYNILDAVYHKFVLGTILRNESSATKFIVQDFDQVDKQLQNIEKEIIHYLGSFSIDSDFVGLNGFKANAEYEAAIINLLECSNKSLLDYVKANGNLSISPLHPTNQVVELTKRKNEEIEYIKSQAKQQISETKNNAILKIKGESEEKEKAIEAIKKEYSSADKTITELKKKLVAEKNATSDLNEKLEGYDKKLKELTYVENHYQKIKEELNSKEKEIKELNNILSNIKQSFSDLDGVAITSNVAIDKYKSVTYETNKAVLEKLNKFYPLISLAIMLIILLMIVMNPIFLKNDTFSSMSKKEPGEATLKSSDINDLSIKSDGDKEKFASKIFDVCKGDTIVVIHKNIKKVAGNFIISYVIKRKVVKYGNITIAD